MSISRRDFMKIFGAAAASLLVTRCKATTPTPTCYEPLPPTALPPTAIDRLRTCWQGFGDLAQATSADPGQGNGSYENAIGQQMMTEHKAALNELLAAGEITQPVADLVQEAYDAAVYHVWRSNVPITCYEPVWVDYAPVGANVLVKQADLLSEIASQGEIDPETLAKAQAALEHDMAFYELTDEEVHALYERIQAAAQEQGQPIPAFDAVELEVSLDAQEAARFIIALLTGK